MKSLKKHCGIHSTNALLVDLHSFTTYTYMVKLLRVFSHCRFQCWKLLMHVNSTRQDGLKIEKKKNCVKLWVQSSFLEIVYKRLEVFLSKKYVDFSLRGMWRRDVPYNCTFFRILDICLEANRVYLEAGFFNGGCSRILQSLRHFTSLINNKWIWCCYYKSQSRN